MLNYLNKKFLISFITVSFIFMLDRISKLYIIYLNEKNYGSDLFSSKFLNIYLIWNDGIAFGLLAFDQSNFYNLLTILISIVIAVIFIIILRSRGLKFYALLMVFSGALGNLYDRVFFKAVPDFLDFHIGDFHWFIFNVSDIFITLGIIFMIILELIDNSKKKINEKI